MNMVKYEEPLIYQMVQITKKYLSAFASLAKDIPLERYHYALLLIDEHQEKLTQKELAKLLQVDKSFIVSMIDYLASNELVCRETNCDDRRQHFLILTEKATKIIPMINQVYKSLNKQAFAGIEKDKINQFFEVIKDLQNNLKPIKGHPIIVECKNSNL
jgi:DNA-binding MarR family transcriptional regulator